MICLMLLVSGELLELWETLGVTRYRLTCTAKNATAFNLSHNLSSNILSIEDRIADLESNATILSLSDEKAITFYNFGSLSKNESGAWLDINVPGGNFGFLIDFHTLLKHIHHAITGVDILKQLQNEYKLKLNTFSGTLAVTPEVSMPRFLSSLSTQTVVDNEASYFTHIHLFKKWNDPSSGYKYCLKKEL